MTSTNRWRRRLAGIALAAAAALTLVFAACGGDDDDDDGDDNGGEPAATTVAGSPTTAAEESPDTGSEETPSTGGGVSTIVATDAGELGTILTTLDGYTLYVFATDVAGSGTSTCEGGCADAWPPLPVQGEPSGGEGVTGEVGTITRTDGSTQVTYDGKPLYMFVNDAAPGDTNGKDVPNWDIAVP